MPKLFNKILGITVGDPVGIGPETVINALNDILVEDLKCKSKFIIYAPKKLFEYLNINLQKLKNGNEINSINEISEDSAHNVYFINPTNELSLTLDDFSQSNDKTNQFALRAIEKITEDAFAGVLDGIITGPVNKANINKIKPGFTGHTDFIANQCNVRETLMMFYSNKLKTALFTTHIPLKKLFLFLNKDKLKKKLTFLLKHCGSLPNMNSPIVDVVSINPHGGENGTIGTEEFIIKDVVDELKQDGLPVNGPFPIEIAFKRQFEKKNNCVFCMYHDQALLPFKIMNIKDGVNITLGLPFVRTSPLHGTAYDIAGKGVADWNSFKAAIKVAINAN